MTTTNTTPTTTRTPAPMSSPAPMSAAKRRHGAGANLESHLLTKAQAAALLGIGQRTFDRMRQTHDLGEVRLPTGGTRFRRSTLVAAVESGQFKPLRRR